MSLKNSNDAIGNRTRDLPVCSHHVPHCNLTLELKLVNKGQMIVSELSVGFYDINILLPEFRYVQVLTPLDTVGAVCVDAHGNLATACSSGGVALKHPGRVGQVSLSVLICLYSLIRGNMDLLHDDVMSVTMMCTVFWL